MLELVQEFGFSPMQAAYELDNDREWWAVRLLPVAQFLKAYQTVREAEQLKQAHKIPPRVRRSVAEIEVLRIKMFGKKKKKR